MFGLKNIFSGKIFLLIPEFSWHMFGPRKIFPGKIFSLPPPPVKGQFFWHQIWLDICLDWKTFSLEKNSWLPQKIQSPECLIKENILKNFWSQIWHDPKKLGLRHTPPSPDIRIGSGSSICHLEFSLHGGKMSIWDFTRFGMTKKSWVLEHPPPLKNSESRVLNKGKNFETFLPSDLTRPKKVGSWDPPPPPKKNSELLHTEICFLVISKHKCY